LRFPKLLAKRSFTKIDHPPYSSELENLWFLFLNFKENAIKAKILSDITDNIFALILLVISDNIFALILSDITDIQRNVITLLRDIPEDDFQDCFL
jgi:hypothetical protein